MSKEETFILIVNGENSCAAYNFLLETVFFFFHDSSVNEKLKRTAFILNKNLL